MSGSAVASENHDGHREMQDSLEVEEAKKTLAPYHGLSALEPEARGADVAAPAMLTST
jgi:hypothetical protein